MTMFAVVAAASLISFVAAVAPFGRPPGVSSEAAALVPVWSRNFSDVFFTPRQPVLPGNPIALRAVRTNKSEEIFGINASSGEVAYIVPAESFSVRESLGTATEIVLITWNLDENMTRVRVYDRRTGSNLWVSKAVIEYPELGLTEDQLLWMNFENGTQNDAIAFDIKTGEVLWSRPRVNQTWAWAMCGPRSGSLFRWVCIAAVGQSDSAIAIDTATGAVQWTTPLVQFPADGIYAAVTGGAFGIFTRWSYTLLDALTGAVRGNATMLGLELPPVPAANFGLFCGLMDTKGNISVFCIDATRGTVVFRQSPANMAEISHVLIASKSIIILFTQEMRTQSKLQEAAVSWSTFLTAWDIDGTILWNKYIPTFASPSWYPAAFFALFMPSSAEFYHYRTGAVVATLTGEVDAFMATEAPGKIFVARFGNLTSYKLLV